MNYLIMRLWAIKWELNSLKIWLNSFLWGLYVGYVTKYSNIVKLSFSTYFIISSWNRSKSIPSTVIKILSISISAHFDSLRWLHWQLSGFLLISSISSLHYLKLRPKQNSFHVINCRMNTNFTFCEDWNWHKRGNKKCFSFSPFLRGCVSSKTSTFFACD